MKFSLRKGLSIRKASLLAENLRNQVLLEPLSWFLLSYWLLNKKFWIRNFFELSWTSKQFNILRKNVNKSRIQAEESECIQNSWKLVPSDCLNLHTRKGKVSFHGVFYTGRGIMKEILWWGAHAVIPQHDWTWAWQLTLQTWFQSLAPCNSARVFPAARKGKEGKLKTAGRNKEKRKGYVDCQGRGREHSEERGNEMPFRSSLQDSTCYI